VSIDPGRLAHRDVASYVDVHPLGRQADADAALSALRHWWADSVARFGRSSVRVRVTH